MQKFSAKNKAEILLCLNGHLALSCHLYPLKCSYSRQSHYDKTTIKRKEKIQGENNQNSLRNQCLQYYLRTSSYSACNSTSCNINKAIFKINISKYLTKIKHSTKELQFHIQSSRFLVEQPP